jgi:dual specificity MAP kinase phosphatase
MPCAVLNEHAVVCRSPTVVIGYLMKHRGWRLAEAYKWVKDKRPSIQISEGGWA